MSEEKNIDPADKIIKTHMMISMGAGLVPLPLLDVVAVTAVQLDMLRQLANHYNLDFNEQSGKSFISAIGGSLLARMGASAMKTIPIIGSILGGVTMSILSGASTFAIGNVFKEHFKMGGDFSNIDVDQAKDFFKQKFEEGKQMAKDMEAQVKDGVEDMEARVKDGVEEMGGEYANDDDQPDVGNVASEESENPGPKSFVDQLKELAKMKEQGLLTAEEFEKLKKKMMDRES